MSRRIILLVVLLILLLPLWLWLAWIFTPVKPLNIAIIDKTVLTKKVREHIAFNWLLTNMRITKIDSSFYNPVSDYYGLFPEREDKYEVNKNRIVKKGLEQYSDLQIDSMAATLDMAYFADTYGLYYNEWRDTLIMEHSHILYGGMREEDIRLLAALKRQKKLIIAEFNDIATPTSKNIRNKFEGLFDVEWSGWAGRYFDILDTNVNRELPHWLKNGYKAQHQNKWPFKRPGIAFVHENGRIEILENKTHLNYDYPVIKTDKNVRQRFGVGNEISYPYWFDIMSTSSNNNILSYYVIDANEKGDSILQAHGIPTKFPAVIERKSDRKFYYFCGDFADNPTSQFMSRFKYIDRIKFYFTFSNGTDQGVFFWKYYMPMVSTIMKENF